MFRESVRRLIQNPAVLSALYTLPGKDKLIAAMQTGDLDEAFALLEPQRNLEEIDADFTDLKQDIRSIAGDLPVETQAAIKLFLHIAYAQEEGSKINAKDKFMESVLLLQQMRNIAQDPNAELPSLEDRLNYLMNRQQVIAGIVHIRGEELEEDLAEVRDGVRTSNTKKLIKFRGILQFIGASANFKKLERSFSDAAYNMRSGFERMRSLFARGISPRAQAAVILQKIAGDETIEILQGDNVEEQKAVVSELVRLQETALMVMIQSLEKGEREIYRNRFTGWQSDLRNAKTTQELRLTTQDLNILVLDVQTAARRKKNVLLRFGYRIQDFFGTNKNT